MNFDDLLNEVREGLAPSNSDALPANIESPEELTNWLVNNNYLPANDRLLSEEKISPDKLRERFVEIGFLRPASSSTAPAKANNENAETFQPQFRAQPKLTSTNQRYKMNFATITKAPLANAERIEVMQGGLEELMQTRNISVRFNNHTGLVRSLRGDLLPDVRINSEDEMRTQANQFLLQHDNALLGTRQQNSWKLDSQPVIGSTVRVRQTDQDGIPVYGATATYGFRDDGKLTMVNSAWYSMPPEERYQARFKLTWDQAVEKAKAHLSPHISSRPSKPIESSPSEIVDSISGSNIGPATLPDVNSSLGVSQSIYLDRITDLRPQLPDVSRRARLPSLSSKPTPDLVILPGNDLNEGRIIFPLHARSSDQPELPKYYRTKNLNQLQYRPAWSVFIADPTTARSWKIIVDAEDGEILATIQMNVHAMIRGLIYRTNNHALSGDEPEPVDLIDIASGLLSHAPDFRVDIDIVQSAMVGGQIPLRHANVYYHLRKAKNIFAQIIKDAWPSPISNQPTTPGEDGQILVNISPDKGHASYSPAPSRAFAFAAGDEGDETHPAIGDTAEDCDVIYHEYAHSVLNTIQPDLFEDLPHIDLFNRAINEGTAFYFGCTLSERAHVEQGSTPDHHWGEVAYKEWRDRRLLQRTEGQLPNYDFLNIYGILPRYSGGADDVSPDYATGMVWARALWDVRRLLGYEKADPIILRGISLAGGLQKEFETPAEAIIHVASEYAMRVGHPSYESALRLIFSSRGIMADSPVHDLVKIELGGKDYLLAATENTSQESNASGCMLWDDEDNRWNSLGSNGPTQVVAVAVLKLSETNAMIWAAGEHTVKNGAHGVSISKIYRCNLKVIDGALNLNNRWEPLPDLPNTRFSILSLAAMPANVNDNNRSYWLFAGTENGLYKYNSHDGSDNPWSKGGNDLSDKAIFSLVVREAPPTRRLLVGTELFAYILDPSTMTYDPHSVNWSDYVLTVVRDPNQPNHFWAGTAFDGMLHYHPDGPDDDMWIEKNAPGDNLPVYCLFITEAKTMYAGTNNGLYRKRLDLEESSWSKVDFNPENSESWTGASVISLSELAGKLVVGTAERGVWRQEIDSEWERLEAGMPRLGQSSQILSASEQTFSNTLAADGLGFHLFYLPARYQSLSFKPGSSNVDLTLYYVAPYTNIDSQQWAGLQDRKLTTEANSIDFVMDGEVTPGFYLLKVMAKTEPVTYSVQVIHVLFRE